MPSCPTSHRDNSERRRLRIGATVLHAVVIAFLASRVALAATEIPFASCPSQWTQTPTINPPAGAPRTSGISFGSSDVGWFVGSETVTGNQFVPLAEYWDPSSGDWQLGSATQPPGSSGDSRLDDVIAFPQTGGNPAEAWAAGYQSKQVLLEHWTGPDETSPWQIAEVQPAQNGYAKFFSLSGVSRNDLWAVGNDRQGPVYSALIAHFSGGAWSFTNAPRLNGAIGSGLVGVSADAADDVWAVGYRTDGYGYQPLVEHYDGSAWSVVSGVPDQNGDYAVLTAVIATGSADVWASGYESNGTAFLPLVLHYDGQSWSAIQNGDGIGLQNALSSIDYIPASDEVIAAGFSLDPTFGGYVPFSEVWAQNDPGQITILPPAMSNGAPLGSEFVDLGVEPTGQAWVSGDNALVETVCPSLNPQSPAAPVAYTGPRLAGLPATSGPKLVRQRLDAARTRRWSRARKRYAAADGLVVASDIAPQAFGGQMPDTTSFGAAVGDFAGPGGAGADGFEDFELGRHGSKPLQLWVSNGDGTFRQVDAGEFPKIDRHRCSWGDIGSPTAPVPDGLPDLFCALGNHKGLGIKANELWIQQPDGSFAPPPYDATTYPDAAIIDPFGRGRAPVFFYAGDKTAPPPHPLSLFVGDEITREDGLPSPNRFFYNVNGVLVSSPASGLDREVGGTCAQAVDYDMDNYDDLLVCTTTDRGGGLALYHNDGPVGPGGVPEFTDVTAQAGIDATKAQFGLMSDLNGDSCPDLVIVFSTSVEVDLQKRASGACTGQFAPVWSHPLADGVWAAAGDVNGDGLPDLYVLQGGLTADMVFINNGNGSSFTPVPIPEATYGSGESVSAITDAVTGTADFLVLNGNHATKGPVQLIHFSPNPDPDPLSITSAPPATTSSASASFAFASTDGNVQEFDCAIDDADPNPCTSPITYSDLTSGDHKFSVWSRLGNGNVTAEATWNWTIRSPDNAPVASDGAVTTTVNTSVKGQLKAEDPDAGQTLTYAIEKPPAHGSVDIDSSTGAFTYQPSRDFAGDDRFTFEVSDGVENSNVATESITVNEPSQGGGGGTMDPFVLGLLVLSVVFGLIRNRRKTGR